MQTLLPIPELFKKSFAVYKPRLWPMLLLSLVGGAITLAITAIFGTAGFASLLLGGKFSNIYISSFFFFLVGIVFLVIVNLWMELGLVHLVKEGNEKASVKDILLASKTSVPSYIWAMVLRCAAVAVGLILFIVPGIILMVWFSLAQFAFVFENKKGTDALKHSKELVRGYWWPIFGRVVLMMAIVGVVGSIAKVGFVLNALFVTPFAVVYLYMVYQDLKSVKSTSTSTV